MVFDQQLDLFSGNFSMAQQQQQQRPNLAMADEDGHQREQNRNSIQNLNIQPLFISSNDTTMFPLENTWSSPTRMMMASIPPTTNYAVSQVTSPSFLPRTSIELPAYYTPGPYDVICARGKVALDYARNKYLLAAAKKFAPEYAKFTSRAKRSVLVTKIVDLIREKGNFLRKDENTGMWSEVSDLVAREKVEQNLRNVIGTEFKSSLANKVKRRKAVTASLTQRLQTIVFSDEATRKAMASLENAVLKVTGNNNVIPSTTSTTTTTITATTSTPLFTSTPKRVSLESTDFPPDKELSEIFRKNNAGMLKYFKTNKALVDKFRSTLAA